MQKHKYNIFQRGILQELFTALVGFVCFTVAASVLFLLDAKRFNDSMGITVIDIIAIAGLFTLIGIIVVRFSAKFNFVWPVTLPKAMEFSSALRKMRIVELKKQIVFVRDHKLAVYIAEKPILGEEQEQVRAKLYTFASNPLVSENIFSNNIGKRTLCLDAEEYEQLLTEGKARSSLEESIALAEKDTEIKALKATIASLTRDAASLTEERDSLRGKVRMQPAQDDARVDRLRIERLLWAAYIPVIDRLIQEAPEGKQYTTPEIETAFANEWAQRHDLREQMRQLTGSDEAKPSEPFLKAVKAELKEAGRLSHGGRPRKNP